MEKARDEDFDSHYRYVPANETIRASPAGTLIEGPSDYIRRGKTRARARPITGERKRDKKRCWAIDRSAAAIAIRRESQS